MRGDQEVRQVKEGSEGVESVCVCLSATTSGAIRLRLLHTCQVDTNCVCVERLPQIAS